MSVDAYQAKGGEKIRTILANGQEEVRQGGKRKPRIAQPGQWIVRQKNGEVLVIDDAKFRKLYLADEPGPALA